MAVETAKARTAPEGKFLSFVLGGDEYGLEILKVQEITGMRGITRVPHTPDYVRGVITLRGRVIPIVSLRHRFALPAAEDTDKTCIIIVQAASRQTRLTMGIIVDEVADVLSFERDGIDPPPRAAGGPGGTACIAGVGRTADKTVFLLDVDTLLDGQELEAVAGTMSSR
jgi:purine-binding chemotaxis protein CheW